MQLFSAEPTIVLKLFEMFVLTTKIWKKHPQKLLRIPQIYLFPLTALCRVSRATLLYSFSKIKGGLITGLIDWLTMVPVECDQILDVAKHFHVIGIGPVVYFQKFWL